MSKWAEVALVSEARGAMSHSTFGSYVTLRDGLSVGSKSGIV